jgi:hypothetical protein
MSHVLLSIFWLMGSIYFIFVLFYYFISERKEGTRLIRILLCVALLFSMCCFGFSLDYWNARGMGSLANFGGILFFISVFVAISGSYNIISSKHTSREKIGSESTGPFSYRETYTINESSPEDARFRGYIKMVCIIIFHQVFNIIYLCYVLFG